MQSATKTNQSPRIERGTTKIYVPHEGGEISFSYPSTGLGTYTAVGKEILTKGQQVPTGNPMASLLHSAYCNDSAANEPEFQNVRDIIKNRRLWVFNRNLWTSEGVYVIQDLKAVGRSEPLNQNELEKMLSDGKKIQGVVFGNGANFARKKTYKLGEQDTHSLAKNGFVIASYGVEGADKLAEVSAKFKNKPFVYGLDIDNGKEPFLALSVLGSSWLFFGCRLDVRGTDWAGGYDYDNGSFGVFAPEKSK